MTEPAQGTGRVLVVEDDESTGLFVTRVLRRHGFKASWVVDAEQASALMTDEAFDVLLADYRLPGRSGIELAADTRRLAPAMGIAVMTSAGATGMEQTARSNGADDFFEKPLYSADFVERITELVRRSRSVGPQSNGTPPAQSARPACPVATAPGVSPGQEIHEVPNVAESGSGEQAPTRGGVLAWRDTDRTSGSGGPLGEGTGGISQARCSALLKLPGQDVVRYGSETFAPHRQSDLTERDLRSRASHPSAWRRSTRRPLFVMWASADPAVSVGSAICVVTSPQAHTTAS